MYPFRGPEKINGFRSPQDPAACARVAAEMKVFLVGDGRVKRHISGW